MFHPPNRKHNRMNTTHFEFIDIHSLTREDILLTLSLMTPQKHARVQSFPHEDDRLRSIAAEYLARSSIARHLSIPEEEIIIDQRDSGQPFVRALPCHISLSHSGHLAMAAVSNRPIGADIEIISSRGERLISRICSDDEQAYIFGEGAFSNRRFFSVWTAKEAILKHSGKGLSGGLASTVVADSEGLLTEVNGHSLISGFFDDAAYSIYC